MANFPENSERTSQKFCARIKELMEESDYDSNMKYAKFLDVSFPVISKAVNFGIIPSTKILIKIADKLDISISYLLGQTDENDFIASSSPTTFQVRLKSLAEEKNETFGAISAKMPFIRNYFYDWIRLNTLPSIEYANMIADYFKVSLDYLFGRSDYRK